MFLPEGRRMPAARAETPRPRNLLNSGASRLVAGARNHLQANRSLRFCFEIPVSPVD
jgi:hypothetical protein